MKPMIGIILDFVRCLMVQGKLLHLLPNFRRTNMKIFLDLDPEDIKFLRKHLEEKLCEKEKEVSNLKLMVENLDEVISHNH